MDNKVAQPLDYIVQRALEDQLDFLKRSVTGGLVEDHAEYKYLCGQIRGIHFAMDCLKEARGRMGLDGDLE